MITEFLWDVNPPKIRYAKLIQNYQDGGLKLPDVESKERAYKCCWLKYLYNNEAPWFYGQLPIKDIRIWMANITPNDVQKLTKYKGNFNFANSVLLAWSKVNYEIPVEFNEIYWQTVWGNSRIIRSAKPIFDKWLLNSNIDYVHQLFNRQENRFCTLAELNNEIGCQLNELQYNQLKATIPATWKSMLKYESNENIDLNHEHLLDKIIKAPVKLTYWIFVQKQKSKDGCKQAWEVELHTEISEDEWSNMFIAILEITHIVKLRMFHYRIVNRILTTNVTRHKYNKNICENCTFCKYDKETVKHLFWECIKVKDLWKNLSKWVKYFLSINLKLNYQMVIFNQYTGHYNLLLNTMILVLKRYIYVSKCFEKIPNFNDYLNAVNETAKIEKITAYRKRAMTKFNNKWKTYLEKM